MKNFKSLPKRFYTELLPESFSNSPTLLCANNLAGELIGLNLQAYPVEKLAGVFSGNTILPGSEPFSTVYSGHQFGVWAGQLGDGRAIYLGQVKNVQNEIWDIQLKGSGRTPYSRFGDGRAVLRSCIREYLCAENIHALNIPTSRSLAIVGTGEMVQREILEPGAVYSRIAPTHIRFGHFEHFAHNNEKNNFKILLDYTIKNFFPYLETSESLYLDWFKQVIKLTASLIAKWDSVGFCHGVMNTDNMSITGLTIDYGPFGFLETYDTSFICNHSDSSGRYSFGNQFHAAKWNLYALANCLTEYIRETSLLESLDSFDDEYREFYKVEMLKKIALPFSDENFSFVDSLLKLIENNDADYTLSFRNLSKSLEDEGAWLSLFQNNSHAFSWLESYKAKLIKENKTDIVAQLDSVNPKFVLRNWVAEDIIRKVEDQQNFSCIDQMLLVLQHPFSEHSSYDHYALPAPTHYRSIQVSCSS